MSNGFLSALKIRSAPPAVINSSQSMTGLASFGFDLSFVLGAQTVQGNHEISPFGVIGQRTLLGFQSSAALLLHHPNNVILFVFLIGNDNVDFIEL
jgi:hypothetical protein